MSSNRMRNAMAMKRDLPPRRYGYSQAEVLDALGHVHPVLELPGSRYSDPASLKAAPSESE